MNKKGVALVEIMVSMIILAVAALAVAATVSLVNSQQHRSAGGSSLDVQALSYARETLESLKNAVSTSATGAGAPLVGSASGTLYDITASLAGSDLAKHGGKRTYTVTDVDASTPPDGVLDYKRVTVTVLWND